MIRRSGLQQGNARQKKLVREKTICQNRTTTKEMNAIVTVNSLVDRHPFNTGTLILLVVGSMLIIYGVLFLILKMRK